MSETRRGRMGRPPARHGREQSSIHLSPVVHKALHLWAADELRTLSAQIEYLVRRALREAGRLPEPDEQPVVHVPWTLTRAVETKRDNEYVEDAAEGGARLQPGWWDVW